MSLKKILYDDRYFHDRYFHDRYFYDRYFHDRYNTTLNPRHYWNYYYPHWYRSNWNEHGTLRFNRHHEVPIPASASTTKLYYPSAYTPPLWAAPRGATEIKIERMPLQRSNSYVSIHETKNETVTDENVETKYECSVEEKNDNGLKANSGMSKSMHNMGSSDVKPVVNSVTYVYDTDKDKHRHVTYVKHVHNDAGDSLAGNLVKSSDNFLPVNRSVNVGPIFNGNSFGILSEHVTIRDTFHLAFQFKTTQQNGCLLSIVDRSTGDAFFIELYDSQLKATLFVDGEADSCWTDFNTAVLSNDIWSDVEINIVNNRMSMTVRNEIFTKTHRFPFRRPIRGDIFVGGYPATAAPPFVCRSKDFFVGEMRNFYLNNDGVKWYGAPSHHYPRLRNWYW